MPRPFPVSINVGTDICSIARIRSLLEKFNGPAGHAFFRRILTRHEIEQNYDRLHRPLEDLQKVLHKRAELDKRRKQMKLRNEDLVKRKASISFFLDEEDRKLHPKLDYKGRARKILGIKDPPKPEVKLRKLVKEDREDSSEVLRQTVLEKFGAGETGIKKIDDLDIMISLMEQLTREEWNVKNNIGKTAAFLAGRFAAKEAAIKAHHTRQLTYHDIAIHTLPYKNGRSQAPVALIKSELGRWVDSQVVPLSISHDGDYATAVCLSSVGTGNVYLTQRERAMEAARRGVMHTKGKSYRGNRHVRSPSTLSVNLAKESAVFVEGLLENVDSAGLTDAFKPFSEGVSAHVCKDRQGRPRGYGFVVLGDAKKAAEAIRYMDNTVLKEGVIRCVLAKDKVEERLNPDSIKDFWVDVGKSMDFEEKMYEPEISFDAKPEEKVEVKVDPAEEDELEFWRKTEEALAKQQEASFPKDDDEVD